MIFQSFFQLQKLCKNQWLKTSELEEIQRKKLRRIIKHAYENVSYYHHLFDSVKVKPEDIKDKSDLPPIPITTKRQLQALPINEVVAKGFKVNKCIHLKTSGTTGTPFDVGVSEEDARFRAATFMRAFLANGYRLTDQRVEIVYPEYYRNYRNRWYQYLGIKRLKYLSVFDHIDDLIIQLKRIRPDFIEAYPSTLGLLAERIKERGIRGISPRIILSRGEILTQETRETIDSLFRVKMVDFYNSCEVGCIAWECDRHEGYHVNIDGMIIEFIDNSGKIVSSGDRGEMVITNLNSYAMPFIRYNTGDMGIPTDRVCSCGRGLPLLKEIEGRADDLIRLSDRTISPRSLATALRFASNIAQFRVIHQEGDKFSIQLVGDGSFRKEVIPVVRRKLKEVLGNNVHLDVQILDELPRDPSSKHRLVISKVK